MGQLEDLQTKVNELFSKITELEKTSNSVTQLSEKIDNLVASEIFNKKIETITTDVNKNTKEIEALKKKPAETEIEKAKIEDLIKGKLKELKWKVFLWDMLKISALVITILCSIITFYVLKMNDSNISLPVKIDLSAGLSVLAAMATLLFIGLYFDKNAGRIPPIILVVTFLFSVITIYILKMNDANIGLPTRIDLSAGLSVLTALFALLFVSLYLDKTKKPALIQDKINSLEILQVDLTNPKLENFRAFQRYRAIVKKVG